jgi:DNA polymerase I-like protein with 3'-5' exonuclease and polymerase domains
VDIIALDTETNDEGLRAERGSAWPWRGGYVCGVNVAWREEGNICGSYFPLRHPDSENFERENVSRWLKDLVASDVRIVTQNGLYDWGWLRADLGVLMPSSDRLEEIGALATLIDENRFNYGLDALCAWRGLPGKDVTLLREAVKAAGWAPRKQKNKINVAEHIYKLPAHLVGPYAEADAIATLALYENLNPILDREGTRDAYRLDVDLLPMVHEMRRRGIRVDQSAAERARDHCLQKRDRALAELSERLDSPTGMEEIGKPMWKARTFDAYGISYPRTEKGNPSFKAGKTGWMATHKHWLPQLIAIANKYDAAGDEFLEKRILEHLVGDRIYAEINPHRSDTGGTRSFRFSYSNPPLQQMPSRDEELAPLIRSVFLPEEGETWCTVDCSQQEFRFVVHHAAIRKLPGAEKAVERYINDPDTDFHELVSELTKLLRKDAKNVNFAKIYGAGVKKFAEMIGKPLSEAQRIYEQYDRLLPFVSRLAAACQREANQMGHTLLYDGARRHWDRWATRTYDKGAGPCSLEEARARIRDPGHPWFNGWLHRADIHTALNALIQGSAARHTKLWMRACWRESIVPLLQMHDGLECSITAREQGELIARLACDAVRLEVPMRADLKFGRSWGDAKHTWEKLHDHVRPETTTRIESLQPQVGFSEVPLTIERIGGLPIGSESEHNPADAENDANGDAPADEAESPPRPPASEPAHVATIPFMITRMMKEQLHTQGFSEQQIFEMTPQRAHELLGIEPVRAAPIEEAPSPVEENNDLPSGGNGSTTWADEDYGAGEQPIGVPTATYIYRTETGAPFMRVVRTTNHQFPTDRWENERWVNGWPARPFLPYRLPELLNALPEVPVFVPEGEKDCERLAALGLIATCNSGGASKSKDPAKSKWWPELNQHFAGKQLVYILEDNDEPGRRLGDAKISALTPIVSEVVRVQFPELREGGDVSDWLDQLNPRTARATLEARCEQARKHTTTGNYVLVRASDIVPRPMDWLWSGHIARGSQELLTGVPGGGKSQIHCALVAAATTGGMWPDGGNGIPPGNVIMLTAEDCLDQTIVPRLIAAGADRARVHILKKIRKDNKERMFLLSEDIEQLEVMIRKVGNVWLITIDPITAYMGGKIDSHRATDVRGQLGPLADLAERADVALSAITHPPKHSSQRAIDHFIGSQAFIAAARIGHLAIEEVEEDEHRSPTGRSLFTNPKNNLSRKMPTLAYRIAEKELDGGIKAAHVIWEDIVDITADQAIAASTPAKKSKTENVVEFLLDILASSRVPFEIIEQRGIAHGFSKRQLDYAKQKIDIVTFKEKAFQGRWFWSLPEHAPQTAEDGTEL